MHKYYFGFLGLFFSFSAQAAFSDVSQNYPHKVAIDYVQSEGIVSGYPDGTFKPGNTINRAELTKILLESITDTAVLEACEVERVPFSVAEVPPEAWFTPYICQAYIDEIISGYPDNTFRPAQAVKFTEAAKILANVYAQERVKTTDVWYEGYALALAELNVIPVQLSRFDGDLTRGQLAEMIYRLNTKNTTEPSQQWDAFVAKTIQAQAEPEVRPPLPEAEPKTPTLLPPTAGVSDPFDFLPAITTKAIKELQTLKPRTAGDDYYVVNRGNVWLWWTQADVFPTRTILLIEGDSTPQHARGLWKNLQGSTLKDIIIYSVPPGNEAASVKSTALPPVLSEVVKTSYGGSFSFKAGVHAHAELGLEGVMKKQFELLSLPLSGLYLTAGEEIPPLSGGTLASGALEEHSKKGTFKEGLKPTKYIEISHSGVWKEPLDIAGLELTDTTVYYDDGNNFGLWGVGPFEGVMSSLFYQGPLVKSKDPKDYAAAQVGFGAAEMTLPLYLKFMAAYQSRLPNGDNVVFQNLDTAKTASLQIMQAGLDALPLDIVKLKQPALDNFKFKSGDKFPGLDKFNLVILGPLAQSKDGTAGPLVKLEGEAHLLGEKFGTLNMTTSASKAQASATGNIGLSLGSVGGEDLGSLGSSVGLEIYADSQTSRMKLRGAFSAGPLGSQGVAVNLGASRFDFSAPASCGFPFLLKATSPITPTAQTTLSDINFTPELNLPEPAQLLSCPEDIYFMVKNGVTYAFNKGVALAEMANSYLPENEVTRIGIEGLKFAGGLAIEAPEEILSVAKDIPGVSELNALGEEGLEQVEALKKEVEAVAEELLDLARTIPGAAELETLGNDMKAEAQKLLNNAVGEQAQKAAQEAMKAADEILDVARTIPGAKELEDLANGLKSEATKMAGKALGAGAKESIKAAKEAGKAAVAAGKEAAKAAEEAGKAAQEGIDTAVKAIDDAAKEAQRLADEARRAAEEAANAAKRGAEEAATAAQNAINSSVGMVNNAVSDPGGTLKSIGGSFSDFGSSIGGAVGLGGSSSSYYVTIGWHGPYTPIKAIDVGAGHNGDNWVVGENGYPLKVDDVGNWGFNFWYKKSGLPSDFPGFVRIDSDKDGYAAAVDKKGRLWNYDGTWRLTNTYATDVGLGGGYIWITSTQASPGGYKIFRAPFTRGATSFAWKEMGGAATRIDVGRNGKAWVINDQYQVWEWNNGWTNRNIKAIDISVSGDNRPWVVGLNYDGNVGGGGFYMYEPCVRYPNGSCWYSHPHWVSSTGRGRSIGAGEGRQLWSTNHSNDVYAGSH